LGRKRAIAVAALLSEPTHAEAARKAGVSLATLGRWLADPDFARAFRAARRRVVDAAVTRLQQVTMSAVLTLDRNLCCGKPAVEVAAARAVLEQALRSVELGDLLQRVEELERHLQGKGDGDDRERGPAADPAGGGGPGAGGGPPAGPPAGGPGPADEPGGDGPRPVAGGGATLGGGAAAVPLFPPVR
jgi:hypothetical protein